MSFFRTRIDTTRGKRQIAARFLANDAALVITDTDKIIIVNSVTGTKAATFNWTEQTTAYGGANFKISMQLATAGSYTVACTRGIIAGTVTIDAVGECPEFQRIGSTLYLVALNGSTFA